mgnify:CR=1 FL=1
MVPFQKGKIDGTPVYDGTYQKGGEQNPYGSDKYKNIQLIYPDGSIKTQSMNEKMFKSGYIDYKKPAYLEDELNALNHGAG